MKHQKRMYLDDSSEIERIILAEINAPGIKKADVLLDLLKLGILAKRVGIHPIAGRIVYIPEVGSEKLLFVSEDSKTATGNKVGTNLADTMQQPAFTEVAQLLEAENEVVPVENSIYRNNVSKISPVLLDNLRKLAKGNCV